MGPVAVPRGRPRASPRPAPPSPTAVPVVVLPVAPLPRGVPGPAGTPSPTVSRPSPVPAASSPPTPPVGPAGGSVPPCDGDAGCLRGPPGPGQRAVPPRCVPLTTKSSELVAPSTRSAVAVDGRLAVSSRWSVPPGARDDAPLSSTSVTIGPA